MINNSFFQLCHGGIDPYFFNIKNYLEQKKLIIPFII